MGRASAWARSSASVASSSTSPRDQQPGERALHVHHHAEPAVGAASLAHALDVGEEVGRHPHAHGERVGGVQPGHAGERAAARAHQAIAGERGVQLAAEVRAADPEHPRGQHLLEQFPAAVRAAVDLQEVEPRVAQPARGRGRDRRGRARAAGSPRAQAPAWESAVASIRVSAVRLTCWADSRARSTPGRNQPCVARSSSTSVKSVKTAVGRSASASRAAIRRARRLTARPRSASPLRPLRPGPRVARRRPRSRRPACGAR